MKPSASKQDLSPVTTPQALPNVHLFPLTKLPLIQFLQYPNGRNKILLKDRAAGMSSYRIHLLSYPKSIYPPMWDEAQNDKLLNIGQNK